MKYKIKVCASKTIDTYLTHHVTQVMWSKNNRGLNPKQIPVLEKLQETGKKLCKCQESLLTACERKD